MPATPAEIRTALANMVANVTTSAALAAVLAGKAIVHKDHVAIVIRYLNDTCAPVKGRGRRGEGAQAGGAGTPWAFETGDGAATPSALASAAAYGPGFGAGTSVGRVDFDAGVARPAMDMSGGAAAVLTVAALRDSMRKVLRQHNVKIAKDARALLERTLAKLGACFVAEATTFSDARLQRAMASRRYKVFRA